MEIERKYLVHEIPVDLTKYQVKHMEQMYVSVKPVIRIRRTDDRRVLTVKSKGLLSRQEFEMDLDEDEYRNLRCKADGNIIEKDRYIIPLSDTDGTCGDSEVDRELKIELDVFDGIFGGLTYAEVEFPEEKFANTFVPPTWFGRDVTEDGIYQNSALSGMDRRDIDSFVKSANKEESDEGKSFICNRL